MITIIYFIAYFIVALLLTQTLLAIFLPIFRIITKAHRKAPRFIQKEAEMFFETMGDKPSLHSWYKKIGKFTTVYLGATAREMPSGGHASYIFVFGGIYLPQKTLENNSITPYQRALICHEVAHAHQDALIGILNMLLFPLYKKEYLAEKKCLETLYKLHMYEEIGAQLERVSLLHGQFIGSSSKALSKRNHPYIYGTIDTLKQLIQKNQDDKRLTGMYEKYIQSIKDSRKTVLDIIENPEANNYPINRIPFMHLALERLPKEIAWLESPEFCSSWKQRQAECKAYVANLPEA